MKELNQLRIYTLIGNMISLICIFIGFFLFATTTSAGIIFFIGGMAGFIIVSMTVGKRYTNTYKEMICKGVIEKMFDVKIYDPNHGFTKDFVRSTYLISTGNQYKSDDYIVGSYNGVEFERSDVCMQDRRKTGKSTTTVTLFKGSWTIFSFPKKISTYLMIREKEFLSNGRPGGFFSDAPQTSKVTFEDIEFNDKFEVYAQDEHDAFYVCTPQFIERIKKLEASHEGRLTIGIIDQKVHVLFYNDKNAMEPSLLKEVNENDFIQIEKEMSQIIEIMDSLDLIRKA